MCQALRSQGLGVVKKKNTVWRLDVLVAAMGGLSVLFPYARGFNLKQRAYRAGDIRWSAEGSPGRRGCRATERGSVIFGFFEGSLVRWRGGGGGAGSTEPAGASTSTSPRRKVGELASLRSLRPRLLGLRVAGLARRLAGAQRWLLQWSCRPLLRLLHRRALQRSRRSRQ